MNDPFTERQAQAESERCLRCFDAPCSVACPAEIDIPAFIGMIRSGNLIGAAEVVKSANAMANVCGKVCPEEIFCQGACIRAKQDRPIAIRELHFHATQFEAARGYSTPRMAIGNGISVAVIGGGPAGLSCAFELTRSGYHVDLYDRALPGGVPRNSIPLFRLSDGDVRSDLDYLTRFIDFHQEDVAKERFLALEGSHKAVFVAVGLRVDKPLPVPGSDLPGVLPVLRFLETAKGAPHEAPAGERVVIVGGGNVSLDAAATAKRMGCREVVLLYRRGEREMRVWTAELEAARSHGVQILFFTNPVEILGSSRVEGIRCRRTRLSTRFDATDRPIPVDIDGSEFTLQADVVIPAIGQVPGDDFLDLFEKTPQGYVNVGESFSTSRRGVFAGGDVVGGEGTIVQSVGHGKKAARGIHSYLTEGARR